DDCAAGAAGRGARAAGRGPAVRGRDHALAAAARRLAPHPRPRGGGPSLARVPRSRARIVTAWSRAPYTGGREGPRRARTDPGGAAPRPAGGLALGRGAPAPRAALL